MINYYVIFASSFSLKPFIQVTSTSKCFFLPCMPRTQSALTIFSAKGLCGPSPYIFLFSMLTNIILLVHTIPKGFPSILSYCFTLCIFLRTILHSKFKYWEQAIFAFQAPLCYEHSTVHILLAVTPFAHISSWFMTSVSTYEAFNNQPVFSFRPISTPEQGYLPSSCKITSLPSKYHLKAFLATVLRKSLQFRVKSTIYHIEQLSAFVCQY